MSRPQQLVKELRRRRIFRSAGIYIVGAWVAVQVASLIFPGIGVPDAAIRYVWIAALLLFPLFLVSAWFFDISSDGLIRTPPAQRSDAVDLSLRKTDFVILAALAIVGIAITWQLTATIRGTVLTAALDMSNAAIAPNSIAVLPLENHSGDPEQQYFVSGMHDALISSLSRISSLRVTSRTSTNRFHDTMSLPREIASQLGVANLIEGSIFRVGDRVRISVNLIDAREDRQIWSEEFEDDVEDVLRLQGEVAQAIAEQVEAAVSAEENARFEAVRTVNPAAYEAYLRGQFHVERFTPQDMMIAAQYYQQALKLDPDYALAHWGISKLCGFQAQAGVISPEEAWDRCLPPIERALALDDSLPEAHMGYASHMTWQRFNWEDGASGFERAIDLNPSYAEGRMFYSHYLTLMGRGEEGSEQMRIALELDPFNPFVRALHGAQLLMIGKFQESVNVIDEVMATSPGFGFGYIITWQAHHALGDKDAAIKAAANHFRVTRGDATGALALERAWADGDYEAALLHAAEVLEEHSRAVHVPPMNIGMLYEQAGRIEKAIAWYEIAVDKHDPDAPYLAVLTFDPRVQHHPRFIQLLREMGHDYWADRFSTMQESADL